MSSMTTRPDGPVGSAARGRFLLPVLMTLAAVLGLTACQSDPVQAPLIEDPVLSDDDNALGDTVPSADNESTTAGDTDD